jgi:hypothetical protein
MIQDLIDLQDYFRSSSECSTWLSASDGASPALILLNWNFYKWRTISRVCYWVFSHKGAYIGVEGSLHRLGKVNLEQMDGQPTGHFSRFSLPSSLGSFLVNQHRDVSTKSRAKLTQTLAGRPLGPIGLGFGPPGRRVKYTTVVMLILTSSQLHFVIH